MELYQILEQNDSNKVVLLEIDKITEIIGSVWIPMGSNTWATTYWWDSTTVRNFSYGFGAWGYGPYGSNATNLALPSIVGRERLVKSTSFYADNIAITDAGSLTSCYSLPNSFYFDIATQILYFHTTTGNKPTNDYAKFDIGLTKGFSNYSGYFGTSIYYDGRVNNVGNLNSKRDPLFFGLMNFEASSTTLINTDGYFDSFGDTDYYGSTVRMYLGSRDLDISKFKQIYEGYVDEYSINTDKFTIKIKDIRSRLTTKIGTKLFNKTDFPYLNDDDVSKTYPLLFGYFTGAKPICTNQDQVTSTYNFVMADTSIGPIAQLSTVYVKNGDFWDIVIPSNVDLTAGTFTLSSIQYTAGNEVRIVGAGHNIDNLGGVTTNPFSIIRALLLKYTPCVYTNEFFTVTQWDNLRNTYWDYDIQLIIEEQTDLIEIIEKICSSCFGLFWINEQGQYAVQVVDPTLDKNGNIYIDEILSPVTIKVSGKEYISSVIVNYDKNFKNDKYKTYLNESSEAILFNTYRQKVRKEFTPNVGLMSSAYNFANKALAIWGSIGPTYTLTVPLSKYVFGIATRIQLEVEPLKYVKCEVMSKSINLNNYTVTFELRYVEDITSGVNNMAIIRYNKWGK